MDFDLETDVIHLPDNSHKYCIDSCGRSVFKHLTGPENHNVSFLKIKCNANK